MATIRTEDQFAAYLFWRIRRRIRPRWVKRAKNVFQDAKERFLEAILEHPVSQELIQHSEPSDFLDSRSGTLFGFMGFEAGRKPVADLVKKLEEDTRVVVSGNPSRNKQGVMQVKIFLPNKKDFDDDEFSLVWQRGLPWPRAIETGISGLPYFLNKQWSRSVSQEGFLAKRGGKEGGELQVVKKGVKFTPQDYLTPIIEQFRKDVKRRGLI